MGPFQRDLSIAGIPIRMETEREIPMTEPFRPFLTREQPRYTGRFRRVERLPEIPEEVLYTGNCYRAHPGGLRSFFDAPKDPAPYAVARTDHDAGEIAVDYLETGAYCVSQMDNTFFHLGFEGLLIRENRVCIHASCIRTEQGGILFSGPSGIGKSTQARLWCEHRGAELINGDRPILERRRDGFWAWGSPYAGSSRCFVNESVPVTAVVFLAQEKRNRIRRLRPGEAFRRIYGGLTMYSWDREFVSRACDLATEIAERVPCYEFGCVPDETAVAFLEERLKEDTP